MAEITFSELAHFTPKQWEATEVADAYQYTLFGGSRGPGKSFWLRWGLVRLLLRYAAAGFAGVRVMLASEDYPSLYDRQMSKIEMEFPAWLGSLNRSQHEFRLKSAYGGGVVALRNLDDPAKYQGAEFAAIAVDELAKNRERTFHILRSSKRWPGMPDGLTKFIAASNPEANWVRSYWIEKVLPKEMAGLEGQFAFVPALADDNPHLDSAYWEMLGTLPGPLAQAWRWGNWYAAVEGLVYDQFGAENITEQEPDLSRPFELAIDDGYIDPRAILFIQRSGTHILVFDEIYHSRRLEEESIEEIRRRCEEGEWAGETERRIWPELAAVSHEAVALRKRLQTADIPARNWLASHGGVKGSVRIEAIKQTRALICDGKGQRTILVHKRCRNLIGEITSGYKYEEGRRGLDEAPVDGNDHACQALESWVWLRSR